MNEETWIDKGKLFLETEFFWKLKVASSKFEEADIHFITEINQ